MKTVLTQKTKDIYKTFHDNLEECPTEEVALSKTCIECGCDIEDIRESQRIRSRFDKLSCEYPGEVPFYL